MFVYMNMFSTCLKIGMARCCLKTSAPFEHNKMDALLGWFHTIGGQCKKNRTIHFSTDVLKHIHQHAKDDSNIYGVTTALEIR